MLKIRNEDMSFASKQALRGDGINWIDYLDTHNQDLSNFVFFKGVTAAELKGPKCSVKFFEELGKFTDILYLGFSVIYSALGGRLPKVEKKHIDEALEKPYSEAEFEAELKKRNEFLGRFILGYERQLVLNSFTQGAIAFVLKSVFMAADEEIQWLDKRQKT